MIPVPASTPESERAPAHARMRAPQPSRTERMRRCLCQCLRRCLRVMVFGVALHAGAASAQSTATDSDYSSGVTRSDARFGSQLGAGSQWQSQLGATAQGGGALAFGGGVRLGCSGVDFNGFLHSFDPAELLSEIRNSLLNGAQAAASNYLLTLAYANPTLSSVLDMMDKKYTARFSAFAQACDSQSARARGQDRGARAMAEAGDECFDREVGRGTAPSEAYRRCSIEHRFDAFDLPATASTADFLRKYTHINVTRDIEALLSLLPDERVQDGVYQMQPPQFTVAGMAERLRSQARLALDRMDTGMDPAAIPNCTADDVMGTANPANGCLPATAAALVTSSAFRGARLLGSASRTLFKDALSSQIAIGSMYANLLELFQQTARIDVRASANGDAAHALARRRQMRESIAELLLEADAQVKAQAARMQLVRTQMLALEQVETELNGRARRHQESIGTPQFGMRDLLQFFGAQFGAQN
jgi:hypothetical protein